MKDGRQNGRRLFQINLRDMASAETGILSWSPRAYIAIIADRIIEAWGQYRKRQLALI